MTGPDAPAARVRLDKWLWYARFFRTRSLAARQVAGGHVRVNGNRVRKPAQPVGPGDVLTFAQARRIRVVRILAAGTRRGPARDACLLYEDLSPAGSSSSALSASSRDKYSGGAGAAPPSNPRFEGRGRPTGRDRRQLERARRNEAD